MSQLNTQFVNRSVPLSNKVFSACSAGGDSFTSGDNTFIAVKNGAGSPVTVTVATPGNVQGIAEGPFTFTVPASGSTDVGPFPSTLFGPTAQVTYSSVTTLTIAVAQFGG
jgi:hypothetical protein